MPDTLYQKFVQRWEEVTDLPPQKLGKLTPYYQKFVKYLKVWPWPMLILSALVFTLVIYLAVGSGIAFLVSLLQRGF